MSTGHVKRYKGSPTYNTIEHKLKITAHKITLQVVIHVYQTRESRKSASACRALYVVSGSPTMQELHMLMLGKQKSCMS